MASAAEENQPDEELAALMTSALEQFTKLTLGRPTDQEVTKALESTKGKSKTGKAPVSKKKNTAPAPPPPPAETGNVDRMWKELIDADPALKDHWEKLAESCTKAGKLSLPFSVSFTTHVLIDAPFTAFFTTFSRSCD